VGNPPYSTRSPKVRRFQSKKRTVRVPNWLNSNRFRAFVVWGVLMLGTGALAINLFYVQIVQGDVLKGIARSQQVTQFRPFIPRRNIVDRQGNVLALDRPVFTLYAHPKLFKVSKQEIADQLAPILTRPAADLIKQFDKRDSGIRIEDALTEDASGRVSELGLDGLELIQHQQRLYPYKEMAADIVGYVNADHNGQAGLEMSQQKILERASQTIKLKQMGDGSIMPDNVPTGFLNQDDLQLRLTIDTRLQRALQPILKRHVTGVGAKRGTVIVMDVHSGEILALVSDPSYDPNEFYKSDPERFKTWAITDLYEPGSTFKPITIAIALQEKTVKPDTYISNPTSISFDEWTINGGSGGSDTVTDILINSYNVGTVHIAETLKPNVFYTWLRRLGLGGSVGIDLPSEMPGQFRDRKTFLETPSDRAVTSFGQGFSLTPIKLVQLHSAIANGGKMVIPHVIQGLYTSKGQLYWKPSLPPVRQVFSPSTTKAVIPMMEGAVQQGTGKAARIPGYRVAGKTGTSQKANGFGGYSESRYVTSFVSIFPADKPRFVVLAVIDEPAGGNSAYGGTIAAPVVRDVLQVLVTQNNIAPSSPGEVTSKPAQEDSN
jgi:cell division protein FtsI (penicillin-binding protein 3)